MPAQGCVDSFGISCPLYFTYKHSNKKVPQSRIFDCVLPIQLTIIYPFITLDMV